MTKRKTAGRKPAAATDIFANGAAPQQGGAWIRKPDGTLVRDADTEQLIPDEGEEAASAPPVIPPPAGDADSAGQTGEGQEDGPHGRG